MFPGIMLSPSNHHNSINPLGIIPTYRIDLDLPPGKRYIQMAQDMGCTMKRLTTLFDQILTRLIPCFLSPLRWSIKCSAPWLFKRLHSDTETEELKGIAQHSGVPLYLLIILNVFLDSALGCTSGGVLVKPDKEGSGNNEERMMHFRTLDWNMPELQELLVEFEFVRSRSTDPKRVVARTITYAGFTGCLTGVK